MKIHLSESQVKKLINDYKLVNEQSNGFNPVTKTETVNFSSVWRAGYWKMTSKQVQNLNNQMMVIQKFVRSNPQTKLIIQVEAGESKVTNADNESGGKAVPEGYLSSRRGESMVSYLNNFFKKLENAGVSFTYPEIPKPKTIVGSTPYNRKTATNPDGDDPRDPKYTPEQFVRLKVTATSQSECLVGLKVLIGYLGKTGHRCDEALFELRMNGVSLGIANLNNDTLDVSGFTKTPVLKDPLLRVKKIIKTHNEKMYSKSIGMERRKYSKWKIDNPSDQGNDPQSYVFNGKTIRELGGVPNYRAYVDNFYKKNNPLKVTYNDETTLSKEMIVKMINDRKKYSPIPKSEIVTLYKHVDTSFKFDKNALAKNYRELHKKLTQSPGRTSDKRLGGKRTQTFTIDNNKAKEIFDQGKVKNNKIVLSMIPLVSPSGQYAQYYSKGSHSDVPFVRITKDGESKPKYRGYPSVSVSRGSMSEVTLLETDLCGNPITAKK